MTLLASASLGARELTALFLSLAVLLGLARLMGELARRFAAEPLVQVVEGDADSPELDAWLARRRTSHEPPIAQVYVCPDEEPRALSGAIHLARRLPGCPVIVQTASSGESAGRFLGPGRSPALTRGCGATRCRVAGQGPAGIRRGRGGAAQAAPAARAADRQQIRPGARPATCSCP